jgi:hypothetical protein
VKHKVGTGLSSKGQIEGGKYFRKKAKDK